MDPLEKSSRIPIRPRSLVLRHSHENATNFNNGEFRDQRSEGRGRQPGPSQRSKTLNINRGRGVPQHFVDLSKFQNNIFRIGDHTTIDRSDMSNPAFKSTNLDNFVEKSGVKITLSGPAKP